MSVPAKQRNIPVDTLRGLACIMLVAYHVIGITPQDGLRLHDGVLRDSNELLAYIRMPLFTFLSGLVYGWRPLHGDWKPFLKGKIRRLIVPMLVVGTLFAVIQAVTPGANAQVADWHFLHLKPVAHYWFLESLLLIFLVIIPLEQFRVLQTKAGFAAIFFAASYFYIANTGTPWLSIAGAFYLFPYFLAGIFCTRFPLRIEHQHVTGYVVMAAIILFLLFYGHQYIGPRRSPNALIVGTISCVALYLTGIRSRFLAAIGNYSYSVYLFHVFFTAASRIILNRTGITEIWLLFVVGTIAGIAGPIIVDIIASKYSLSRIYLLGKSALKQTGDAAVYDAPPRPSVEKLVV